MSNQLTFNSINLATVNKNNQIWLSSSELAKALDYADTRSVTKIYSQHSDEFTTSMTEVESLIIYKKQLTQNMLQTLDYL